MKRVAYLANPYPAISHTFIFREIQSLRQNGLEVFPVSIDRSKDLNKMTAEEQREADGVKVLKDVRFFEAILAVFRVFVRSPAGFARMLLMTFELIRHGPKSVIKAFGYLAETVLFLDWIEEKDIDHIHEHFANPTAFIALLANRYKNWGYSISVHGPDVFYQVDESMLSQKIMGAQFVRCISHYCRSQLWRLVPVSMWKKFHIVHCGVDPAVFTPVKRQENMVPEILCVGRLTPAKGQHILLEAAHKVREQGYRFRLTFVGDGEDRRSLEQQVKELDLSHEVRFTGALGQARVVDYYRNSDLFVLPSFAEGVPVVLMEAMAQEIPVISTRITGIPELIEHGRTGLLVTPGNSGELAEEIVRVLQDKPFARKLGIEARKAVLREFNQSENYHYLHCLFEKYGERKCLR
jgi:glycosyltransferase involved in cell wall biosynthesis